MRIEIIDTLTAKTLQRDLYVFYYSERGFRLNSFAKQERASTRHKWTGPAWNASDERKPHGSQLDRPTVIPSHVIEDARRAVTRHIYEQPIFIGWFNPDHKLKL